VNDVVVSTATEVSVEVDVTTGAVTVTVAFVTVVMVGLTALSVSVVVLGGELPTEVSVSVVVKAALGADWFEARTPNPATRPMTRPPTKRATASTVDTACLATSATIPTRNFLSGSELASSPCRNQSRRSTPCVALDFFADNQDCFYPADPGPMMGATSSMLAKAPPPLEV